MSVIRTASLKAPYLLCGMVMLAACRGEPSRPAALASGPSCVPCHQKIVDRFVSTAHFRTSALPDTISIKGSFADGQNVLQTGGEGLSFKMDRRGDGFFQVAIDLVAHRSRSERFDIVVGSGRKGQSYLYWRDRMLFQLPVSYLTGAHAWINSPGYPDGFVDFERPIVPRCLECHSTSFKLEEVRGRPQYSSSYVLGITCAKCHGDATLHVAYQTANPSAAEGRFIVNPGRFSRERQLDNCALCHSGGPKSIRPPFSYRPGEPLAQYLAPPADSAVVPDVHGNQVGLLARSKCFRLSAGMTCSTCHDVHQTERDLTAMAGKCLRCHEEKQHPEIVGSNETLVAGCINCHMSNQNSRIIQFNTPTAQFSPPYRSHFINVPEDMIARRPSHGKRPKARV